MKYSLILMLALCVCVYAVSPEEAAEMSGEEAGGESRYDGKTSPPRSLVLLIPDSTADAIGMYDPDDGEYLGDFIVNDPGVPEYEFQTPINAVQGPAGIIFVSDQLADKVYAFDDEGIFLYVAAETGLNNLRGIDFRNDTLFVTSGDGHISMWSGPDVFEGYWVQSSFSPFDVLFTDEYTTGAALVSDIAGSTDNIRQYDEDGTLLYELFQVSFPEQVQYDTGNPGHYLTVAFSGNVINQFTIDGTVTDSWSFSGGRGIYRLGNGNLLATNGDGVHEIDPASGSIIDTKYTGSCRFIELVDVTWSGTEDTAFEPVPSHGVTVGPNPFHEALSVTLNLPSPGAVDITVFSLEGRIAGSVSPGTLNSGTHVLEWNATGLENGIYFVRVSTPGGVTTEKVQLLR